MSESHANVVSFDENVSTLSNLYEPNEHLLMDETTVENMTTVGTVYESMMLPKNLFGQPGQQTSVGRRMYGFQLKYQQEWSCIETIKK